MALNMKSVLVKHEISLGKNNYVPIATVIYVRTPPGRNETQGDINTTASWHSQYQQSWQRWAPTRIFPCSQVLLNRYLIIGMLCGIVAYRHAVRPCPHFSVVVEVTDLRSATLTTLRVMTARWCWTWVGHCWPGTQVVDSCDKTQWCVVPWVLFSLGTLWVLSYGTAGFIRIYLLNSPLEAWMPSIHTLDVQDSYSNWLSKLLTCLCRGHTSKVRGTDWWRE